MKLSKGQAVIDLLFEMGRRRTYKTALLRCERACDALGLDSAEQDRVLRVIGYDKTIRDRLMAPLPNQ